MEISAEDWNKITESFRLTRKAIRRAFIAVPIIVIGMIIAVVYVKPSIQLGAIILFGLLMFTWAAFPLFRDRIEWEGE